MGLWAIFKENKPWGYYDRWSQYLAHTMTEDAHYYMSFGDVPAGEVWVLEATTGANQARATRQDHQLYVGVAFAITFRADTSGGAFQPVVWSGKMTLKEDDKVTIVFYDCLTNDVLEGSVWGYKMKV